MALSSMTGFARGHGVSGPYAWAWEIKSVNGKGLDRAAALAVGLGRDRGAGTCPRPRNGSRADRSKRT